MPINFRLIKSAIQLNIFMLSYWPNSHWLSVQNASFSLK